MTTIIIHNGDLYGDRKVMVESVPLSFYNRQKIFTSSCGQFGFAMQDPGVDPDNPQIAERYFRKLLERLMIKPPRCATHISDVLGVDFTKWMAEGGDEHKALSEDFALITRAKAFGNRNGMIRELRGHDFGFGADQFVLIGLMHAGRTVTQAYNWVGKNCPMTGGKCDVIKHATLKPFVVQGVV